MEIFLFLFLGAMVAFGLTQGYVGIYGAAVYKNKNPKLFWGQIGSATGGLILLAIMLISGK